MSIADLISRTFSSNSAKRRDELDREIDEHKASMRQTTQVMESGSRVIETYAAAMRLMAEGKNE